MPSANPVHLIPKAPASVNGDAVPPPPPAAVQPVPTRPWSRVDELSVHDELVKIENGKETSLDPDTQALWKEDYVQRGTKRLLGINDAEAIKRKVYLNSACLEFKRTKNITAPTRLQRKASTICP